MAERIPARLTRREAQQFGLLVGFAFLVFGAVLWWRGRTTAALSLGGLGAALVLLGVAFPNALAPIRRAWMGMATVMSRITTPIFMGIVYFGIITPVGLMRRLVGRGQRSPRHAAGTLWVPRDGSRNHREGMEHQF